MNDHDTTRSSQPIREDIESLPLMRADLVERREAVARIIDPETWGRAEALRNPPPDASYRVSEKTAQAGHDAWIAPSLAKADAIEALYAPTQGVKGILHSQPCGEVSADAEIVAGLGAEPSGALAPDTTLYPQFRGQQRADVQTLDAALSLYRGPSAGPLAAAWLRVIGTLYANAGARS